jgi:hypothetical protein
MDLTPLLSSIIELLLSAWYLVAILVLLSIASTPWFKGIMGELMITVLTRWKLNRQVYHLINNVTLPTEDGTTQIDHIIVSVYGVFVIETKNLRGWIFGRPNQKNWTLQHYKKRYKFQNPLHQNHKHIRVLQSISNLEDKQMHSLVVFVGDSEFKTSMPDNVIYGGRFVQFIQSQKTKLLSPKQVLETSQAIEAHRLRRGFKTQRAHVLHVKRLIADKQRQP